MFVITDMYPYSELHVLNKAIIYARDNELCDRVIICHVHRRRGMSSRRGLEHGVQGPSQQSRHTCGTGHADVDSDNDNDNKSAVVVSTNTHSSNDVIGEDANNNNNNNNNNNLQMMMTPPPTKGLGRQSVTVGGGQQLLTVDTNRGTNGSTSKGPHLSIAQASMEQRLQRHNDLFLSIREHQQQKHPNQSSGAAATGEGGHQWRRELHGDGSSSIHPTSHTSTPQTAASRKQRSNSFLVGDRDRDRDRNNASVLHTNLQPMVDAGAHEDLASALGLPLPPLSSVLASKSSSPLVHGRKTIMSTSSSSVLEDREALLQEDRQHKHQQQHDYREYGYLKDDVDSSDGNGLLSEGDETTHPDTAGTATSTAGDTDDGGDVIGGGDEICKRLQENLTLLDHIYPKCKVDLLLVESDEFCPALVAQLSRDLGIQPSFMFIRWSATFPFLLTKTFLSFLI